METPDLYCDECGAANLRYATICFACRHPLTPPPVKQPPGMPDAPTSSGPMQIEINLSSGSMTMIQLQQPQLSLLHERYQVLGKVGTGGFGAVYKARDTHNRNRLVAIKAIELDALSPSQAIEATDTFNRELGLLSTLEHTNLPHVYEHFIDSNHWYLVMDFIDGEPLDTYLQQLAEGRLSLKEVLDIALQLCDVLQYLHELKPPIIFRDLKPANIMFTPGGRLYLIDFGIARRFKPGQRKDTTPLGSPGFAAPEQYGKAQTTPQSDIYSLGATLHCLLTGHDPATTPFNLPPIRSLCPDLPEVLAVLITSMLALEPEKRPMRIFSIKEVILNFVPIEQRAVRSSFQARAAQLRATPTSQAAFPLPMPALTRKQQMSRIFKILLIILAILVFLAVCILSSLPSTM